MPYSKERANPSLDAHSAAEAGDKILEALLDGLGITDPLTIMAAYPQFSKYCFEDGIAKGECISRLIQVLSLIERDNALLAGAIPEVRDGIDLEDLAD
jgi:hypothetical protein